MGPIRAADAADDDHDDARGARDPAKLLTVALGPSPGPLRLFGSAFGTQAAWLLPFALVGLVALLLVLVRGGARRDRRLALFIVFGGWLLAEFVVLSTSNGIVHPYYTSALAPGIGIIAACGAWACTKLVQRDRRYVLLPAAAVALTVAEQISLPGGPAQLPALAVAATSSSQPCAARCCSGCGRVLRRRR